MTVAHLDIESRSTCDLKTAGLYRYWEDPETEILVVRWRIGDGPVNEGIVGLRDHIEAGGTVTGHNIAFDREGWNRRCATRPEHRITVENSDCTMARCAALSLPQSLEQAGNALGLKIQKDVEGRRLMMRMCKPKTVHPDGRVEWSETPEQLARLSEYCAQDVLAECAIDAAVPQLSPGEKRLWVLDQKINARGVMLDMPMVDKALAVAERAALAASEQVYELTDGAVQRTTETAKIVKWLNDRGIPTSSIAKGEQEELLVRADLFDDPLARQVIELRRASAKSSVAKYRAMQRSVCKDGRVRGTLNFHGASTGRWAGRLIQPQNLPRIGDAGPDVEDLHAILAAYDADEAFAVCQLNFGNPLDVLSKALRSMLIAAPGRKLIGGDYSNIEGRVNAWLAGEHWKVEAFADFDAGIGVDLYVLAYAKAFGVSIDLVDKWLRQQGKVMELALGYQGGVRAFQKMAAGYGLIVSDERADELKVAWREAHPAIVKSWYALQDAAINAVRNPGMKVPCLDGKIIYRVASNVLWCRLPSGRPLAYVAPHIEQGQCRECHGLGLIDEEECAACWGRGEVKARVCFYGQNSATKKWQKNALYGGLQCIAEGTPVLTDWGWVPIEKVRWFHRVWDGEEWVNTSGAVDKGVTEVIKAFGGWFTSDHKILTTQGWQSASQSERHIRASCRLPDGCRVPRLRWTQESVGGPVRLRFDEDTPGYRDAQIPEAGSDAVLRVQTLRDDGREEGDARHVPASGVLRVAVAAVPVQSPNPSGLAELRGAGHSGLRGVGQVFRRFLGRHGRNVPPGADDRARQQQWSLRAGELPVGHVQRPSEQQASKIRVVDLIDCGPRNRFVVATEDGPLIVHNCENVVQAIARDILAEGMFRLEDAGYPLVLTVHDENICEVPDGFGSPEELAELMSIVPTWAEGLPVAVESWESERYTK